MTLAELNIPLNKGAVVRRESWSGNKCIYRTIGSLITMDNVRKGSLMEKALLAGGKEKFPPTFIESHYDMIDGKLITVNINLSDEEVKANDWVIWEV